MSAKKFSLAWELQDKQEALLAGEGISGSRRSVVAQELQTMFESCYPNRVNPLPDLRRSYPKFAWIFWAEGELPGYSVRTDIADKAFFVWFIKGRGIVYAESKEKAGNYADVVLFLGEGLESGSVKDMSRVRFLSKLESFANK
jgi:hypothetical protein